MKRIGIAMAVFCALAWTGCDDSNSQSLPVGKPTAADKDKPVEFTVNGANGETAHLIGNEQGVSLPKDFPGDVPIYSGAVVVTAADVTGTLNVTLKTADPVAKVFEFYEKQLKTNGWRIGETMGSKTKVLDATKGAGSLTLMVGEDHGKTLINLGVKGMN